MGCTLWLHGFVVFFCAGGGFWRGFLRDDYGFGLYEVLNWIPVISFYEDSLFFCGERVNGGKHNVSLEC
jgi:hypothetical protein